MMYPHQDLTHKIIAAALEVHRNLGPGLLEAVYLVCLGLEFKASGLSYQGEVDIPILYKNETTNRNFRIDCLVENKIILELKSVETILPVHEAQLLTYLKLTGLHVGLLINFNVPVLKHGIRRRILSSNGHSLGLQKMNIDKRRGDRDAEAQRSPFFERSAQH